MLAVALGDSITRGTRWGVRAGETFVQLLLKKLRESAVDLELVNAGIGGETADRALDRLGRSILGNMPDIVLIMYGTNDSFFDPGAGTPRLEIGNYFDCLVRIIELCREADATPILMTSPPMSESCFAATFEPYSSRGINAILDGYVEECRRVAAELSVPLVDNYRIWSEQAGDGQDINEWLIDGLHPNPEGHRRIAEAILPILLEVFENSKTGP
jgi:acyl-CoA thioesterase-1